MRVREIVIDGFKSYAKRTVIADWDPQFNCITGLNGSGKSNVLDAICFVLGITTLSTVRASNQQDLIYKRGQAGVTKASVSIVFDNTDKSTAPPQYVHVDTLTVTRQVVLGGTSKYLVNGHRAQQSQVHELFQSVQLNVNNPNFLIMQGQITKVVNMRPREILGLIEEAAGTGTYEKDRIRAAKDIQDREAPLAATAAMLREEIVPQLERLRVAKREFLEFQQVAAGVEKIEHVVAAGDYRDVTEQLTNASSEAAERDARLDALNTLIETRAAELEGLASRVTMLRDQLGDQDEAASLETQLQALHQHRAQLQADLEDVSGRLSREHERSIDAQTRCEHAEAILMNFETEVAQFTAEHAALQEEYSAAAAEARDRRELLSGLETGISASGERETGYARAIRQARDAVTSVKTQLRKVEDAKAKDTLAAGDYEAAVEIVGTLNAEVDRLKDVERRLNDDLSALKPAMAKQSQLQAQRTQIRDELSIVQRDTEKLISQTPQLDLPPGFSPSEVLGRIAHLVHVPEAHIDKTQALDVCAGRGLWNLVVDTDATAARVLRSVRTRVTALPLNKMRSSAIPADKVRDVQAAHPENVWLAADLLEFDPKVTPAVMHVFGMTFICRSAAVAREVAYKFKYRAVTLEGDVYDPRGTLMGGYQRKSDNFGVAFNFQRLVEARRVLEANLEAIEAEMDTGGSALAQAQHQRSELELLRHELALVTAKQSEALARLEQAQNAQKHVDERLEQLRSLHDQQFQQEAQLAQTERDAAEFAHDRQGKLRELQGHLREAQNRVAALQTQLDERQARYRDVSTRRDELQSELETQQRVRDIATAAGKELEAELTRVNAEIATIETQISNVDGGLARVRLRVESVHSDLAEANSRLQSSDREAQEARLEAQQLGHDRERHSEHLQALQERLRTLQSEHTWLAGASIDQIVADLDPPDDLRQLKRQLVADRRRLDTLQSRVDPGVVSMIERLERQEAELQRKVATLKQDKRKLEESMAELNQRRALTIERTWRQVSANFGALFGDLLPQSSAELVPLDPPVDNGFTLRVRLGTTWKDGLTELSGGQRSLVALALILALLTFHPAPMYVLDEIDAALDVHHTRNIGHIIKTRFKKSQFIVVSLKDDMFTNANRIFQARFVDGTSTIQVVQ